ncbi:MAG: RnfABCDGE type electron transport complex subunit A [Oscillospiraceae bacterium]|nr:RnfABCDGE type electron transport complex subunit A [Oscillospiraceae bacterium]
MTVLGIILSAILTDNFVLSKFMGCCPFLGVSQKISSSIGMGAAVIFVMTCSTAITYPVYMYLLVPNGLEYLQTLAFILIIALFVQLAEMFVRKCFPPLHRTLGIYLPLITTNCAVLGVTILNVDLFAASESFLTGYLHALLYAACAGVGFTLALILFAGVRSRMEDADIPAFFKGTPATLIAASIVSLSFMAFSGMS